jgi:hypothetical protein
VQIFRQSFSPRKKYINKNIFSAVWFLWPNMSTLTLSFRVRPWHNQAEKLCFNKKAGLLYNKNRFLITLLITVQNFRQSFSPRKKDTGRNIFSRASCFMTKNGWQCLCRFVWDQVKTRWKNDVLTKKICLTIF